MSEMELWTYRDESWNGLDLAGFEIEAIDGGIGKIDEATNEIDSSYVVVDTGPWIFGKKVMLPGGVIDHVDQDEAKVYVNRTKDEIKSSPEFDPDTYRESSYRDELGGYYSDLETRGDPDF